MRPGSNGTQLLNIDTHILIFAIHGELDRAERSLLARSRWSVSSIVFWELATLSRLHVWPIDLAIARASTGLDFRGDPADELIAATSIVHDVPLLTRDDTIRNSKMVPLAL